MARIVGIFACVGVTLALGTILYLLVNGFYTGVDRAQDAESLFTEGFGDVFLGGIAFILLAVFAALVGVVLAAVTGVYAANRSAELSIAVPVGAIGAAVGYGVLTVVIVLFIQIGVALYPGPDGVTTPPVFTPDPEQTADCERILGAGAPACRQTPLTPEPSASLSGPSLTDVAEFGIGIFPATLAGALAAAAASYRSPRRNEL